VHLTIFQTPEYLEAYLQFFGSGKQFHTLQSGDAQAFLMTRGKSARRLEWWGQGIHDIGGACYANDATARDLWHQIENFAQSCHGAHLAQIPSDDALIERAQQSGWTISPAEACPVLVLPESYEAYVKSLGKNMREQIKRYPKRLEKEFKVEYELAESEGAVQSALSDLFKLHGARWRQRGQTGVLATTRRQKFHRAVCTSFLQKDYLRLWSLRCNGTPACVLLNYFYEGKYYFFIGGFDPDLMRWSVGTCLFAKVFQHAIEEGAKEFDFLRGEEEYKYRYGALNRDYKTISWFAPNARGQLLKKRVQAEESLMHRVHLMFSAAHRPKS
jgi:CelD/BcsL family acetyltransferase involved in cellulose biosynthesis